MTAIVNVLRGIGSTMAPGPGQLAMSGRGRVWLVQWLVMVALLLQGCSLITGVSTDRQMGHIGYPDMLSIYTPDSVAVGQVFTVTIRTLGASGCWREDGTDVGVSDLAATVTPYDEYRSVRGTSCSLAVVELTHTAELQFRQKGQATIRFRGRDGSAQRTVLVR